MFVVRLESTKNLSDVAEQLEALKYDVTTSKNGVVYASRIDSSSNQFNSDIKSAKAACKFNSVVKCTPTVYQSEIDKKFRNLASKFDGLEIYPLPDKESYRVNYISKRLNVITTKELPVPLSFFRAVYDPEVRYSEDIHRTMASRGYSVEFIRLFEQGEYLAEKQAILSLYADNFS